MLLYLIWSSIGVIVFWFYFAVLLKKSTFFKLNRWFFLLAMASCLIIPLLDNVLLRSDLTNVLGHEVNESYYETAIVNGLGTVNDNIQNVTVQIPHYIAWWKVFYFLVLAVMLLRFIYSFIAIKRMEKRSIVFHSQGTKVYSSDQIKQPFSFFRSIYLPKSDTPCIESEIILHEQEHIKKNHFVDLLMVEFTSILLWFNPFVYLLKNAVKLNLEYLADEGVVNQGVNKANYQSLLLSYALNNNYKNPITTNFSLPLKNRITMMQKKRSTTWTKSGILGVLPLVFLLMAMTAKTPLKESITTSIGPFIKVLQDENKPDISPLKESDLKRLSSSFGQRTHPVKKVKQMHTGIDLIASIGTPVYATANGRVLVAQNGKLKGIHIEIRHSNVYETRYYHLSKLIVSANDIVKKGDIIGYVGSTGQSFGPHLHYEIRVNGKAVDPEDYFDAC